jgi:hypothetical protein
LQFTVNAGSFTFGDQSTVNSATHGIKISRDVNSVGDIQIAANSVTIDKGTDLVSTGLGSELSLRARGWIDIDNGTSTLAQTNDADFSILQTNNGDIVFWADSDANTEGLIWVSHNTRINSANGVYSYGDVTGGGDIILAGGADDGTGRPAGYAYDTGSRNESAANDGGVAFGKFVDVFTGGGNLVVRAFAKNAGLSAFNFQSRGEFVTGVGQIIIDARASSAIEAFEYWISAETEAGALFSSHASATPAISISASISGTAAQALRVYNQDSANPTTFQSLSSTGGGISITANQSTISTTIGSYLAATNFLSANGPITFSSNAVVSFTNAAFTQHWGERAGTSVSASVANINIVANGVAGNQRTSTFSTSGAVRVLPFTSNFGANINWWPAVNAGSFTLGVDSGYATAVHDVILYSSVTSTGEIKVYAKSVDLDSGYDLITTGVGSGITLKAADLIEVSDGSSNTV